MKPTLTANTLHQIIQSVSALDEIVQRADKKTTRPLVVGELRGHKISGHAPQSMAAVLQVIASDDELAHAFTLALQNLVAAVHDLGETPASVGVGRSR